MGTVKQRSRTSSELKRLQPFLEQIGSVAPDGILSGGRGRTFYHYTDLPGLQGVVTQHDLWLTNSRYSNDNEEMVHGYRIARKIVESEAATGQDPFGRDYLQHLKDLLDKPRSEAVYICCFCEKDNLLREQVSLFKSKLRTLRRSRAVTCL